jgi:hypothetical protein
MDGQTLSDKEWSGLLGTEVRFAKEAFAKPVQSWEDVPLLGALCVRWNFPHHDENDQAEMQETPRAADGIAMDQQSLAQLLNAICAMGGSRSRQPRMVRRSSRRISDEIRLEGIALAASDLRHGSTDCSRRASDGPGSSQ